MNEVAWEKGTQLKTCAALVRVDTMETGSLVLDRELASIIILDDLPAITRVTSLAFNNSNETVYMQLYSD